MEQTPAAGEAMPLAAFLRRYSAELVSEWASRLASRRIGLGLSERQKLDHMPQVLACLAEVVEGLGRSLPQSPFESLSARHALDRLDVGFDLAAVIRENALLREVVVERFMPHATGASERELGLLTARSTRRSGSPPSASRRSASGRCSRSAASATPRSGASTRRRSSAGCWR